MSATEQQGLGRSAGAQKSGNAHHPQHVSSRGGIGGHSMTYSSEFRCLRHYRYSPPSSKGLDQQYDCIHAASQDVDTISFILKSDCRPTMKVSRSRIETIRGESLMRTAVRREPNGNGRGSARDAG
jgi:hypothetical protein